MGGFSLFHLLVLAAIALIVFAPIAVAVFFVVKAVRATPPNRPNLYPCANCGRMVSRLAPTCPQCGSSLQQ
jgi:hypothetical protein